MTHAAVHSPSSHSSGTNQALSTSPGKGPLARLSGERIAASASAITLNAVVLMLMLVPLAAPQLLPGMTSETEAIFIPRDPPPLVPPVPVPVTRPIVPQTASPPVRLSPVERPVVVATAAPVDIAVAYQAPPTDSGDTGATASIATPQAGAQLQYALAPPPAYPREALHAGLRGTVLLQVLVDTDGKPLQVDVAQSSGHRSLDRAAQRHVLARWTFRPAVQEGQPVQAVGLVPVEFALR